MTPAAEKSILLADDSRVTQSLIKLVLEQRGHRVDIAGDGEQALSALQVGNYDFALMDFHLPKVDGLKVVINFKTSFPALKQPCFIGLTADIKRLLADPDSCETFDLIIAKPIDIVHLCSVIENFAKYMSWTREHDKKTSVVQAPGPTERDSRRLARRMKVDRGRTVMALRDGTEYECRVLDLSLGGAALEVNIRPPVGEPVSIGQTEGRVVRQTNEGVAVEFQSLGFPVRP